MITFQNVTKHFGSDPVLNGVNFTIQPKEMVVLNGASGAGKSTIVSLLIGAETPNDGDVIVDNVVVNDMNVSDLQMYRRKVGVAYQDYKLLPRKTVFENVAFAMEVCEEPIDRIHVEVPMILQRVGLLKFKDHFPHQLSGGERQRLGIARALVHNPKLLIADEPTGNLDADNVRIIVDILRGLNKEGATILLTTHDPLVHQMIQTRTLHLADGKISE
ncbi:ATP-binding cassette domain-containing protein [Candidatus Peregrinibacteria bacterium]|nr:MAG: ATP-binding cassette domain-containing protein [Candidatus Peregrinibacteria bacterium]